MRPPEAVTGILRWLAVCAATAAAPAGAAPAADRCVACHRGKTPGAVTQWRASAHARAKVGCAACHGADHGQIDKREAVVDARVCGRCHRTAYEQHRRSRHGMGLHSGWGCTRNAPSGDAAECRFCHERGSERPASRVQCARFLKQSPAVRALGCNRCHAVERSCASCHTSHATDLALVRSPRVCAPCHMGPDHPQWEMWQTSKHGTLFATAGDRLGPTCQTCHMAQRSHDVSRGLTASPTGELYAPRKAAAARRQMLATCGRCHARSFAERELALADQLRGESVALVARAAEVVRDVARRGRLDPMPEQRPAHPLRGKQLVLDAQMLFEDISHLERLFFKMKSFALAKAIKGAFHQNAAYAHWYGSAELKMALVDIRAEAARLLRGDAARPASGARLPASLPTALEAELQRLKREHAQGALSRERYRAARRRLLDRLVAPLGEGSK